MLEALAFIWDPLEEDFQIGLGYLQAYKAGHGDCRVHQHFETEDGFNLGSWCSHRRNNYRNGKLSEERISALKELGFIWDQYEDNYQIGLGYLKAYKEENGNCRVPATFKTEDGFNLGTWLNNRRNDYRKSELSRERIDALEALGFVWDPLEEDYQRGLGYLKVYKAKHEDCRVPARFKTEDGFNLGKWCSHRRNDYRKGKLSDERIEDLEELGFRLRAIVA